MEDVYEQIRQENAKKYGTDIPNYGQVLLASLYSDKTHFVYELIQNAEDACERSRKRGDKRKYFVDFQLFPDRLECRHNGIEFDKKDVKGICGLVMGTKSEDLSQIGKFGIGFKSVYAYTKSPEVYSSNKSFCIRNYVQPSPITKRHDIQDDETLFVIPFNHNKAPATQAFSEINERLKLLGLRTLLFLRNLSDIRWKVGTLAGTYSRKSDEESNNGIRRVYLSYEESGIEKKSEKWLVFEKLVSNMGVKVIVEVAYLLGKHERGITEQIIPTNNTHLVVFFPTQKETHLKFLIQSQYHTTPARDNIYSNDWNKALIRETAVLIAEHISTIKQLNLCNVSFLNTLPIQKELFSNDNIFRPIYDAVKKKLGGKEELLPSSDGKHVATEKALVARGEGLRDLLSSKELELLFGKKYAKWLDKDITEDKTPELRNYLIQELGVPEIAPEKFALAFSEHFVRNQDDSWMKRFYGFLADQKSLWRRKRQYSLDKDDGPLRSKPIIRLEDNSHTPPFGVEDEPLAYLPSNFSRLFPTVKESIARDSNAKEFLTQLGLTEPDTVTGIIRKILPKYILKNSIVNERENTQHIELIAKTLKSLTQADRKRTLLEKLRETPLLWANNCTNSKQEYKRPKDVYLGEIYTNNKDLETYFRGDEKSWFLDNRYVSVGANTLKELGCAGEIRVNYKSVGRDKNVIVASLYGWHKRGLEEFDPDCEIDGLETVLKNMTVDKAKIIWNILKNHYKRIHGTVEKSTQQYYYVSTKEKKYSKMGALLHNSGWLPDDNLVFHKPSDITLTSLHHEFDKKTLEARHVAISLGFQTGVEQELLEDLPEERRVLYEHIKNAPEETIRKILKILKTQPKTGSETEAASTGTTVDSTATCGKTEWSPECKPGEAEISVEDYEVPQVKGQTSLARNDIKRDQQGAPNEKEHGPQDTLSQDAKNAIGRWGEEFALRYLEEKLSKKYPSGRKEQTENGFVIHLSGKTIVAVHWLNKSEENEGGYDIKVIENDNSEYIEVKSTKTDCKEWFDLSRKQWELANESENNYHIYRIYNAGTKQASLCDITNPSKLWREGKITAFPIRIQI